MRKRFVARRSRIIRNNIDVDGRMIKCEVYDQITINSGATSPIFFLSSSTYVNSNLIIYFKIPRRLAHYKKYLPQAHCEPVLVDNGVDKYCMKQETRVDGPWEYGEKPIQRNSRKDWEAVFLKAKQGRIEEIPADIRVRCYSQLKKIEKDHLVIRDAPDVRGVWIYGKAGYGKSRLARRDYPDAYPKLCNKWWDGYNNQKHVIMDDIGPEHKVLGQQLKIWADRYGCILENKGGAMASAYDTFVVTSQYSIEEIFGDDEKTVEALKRRFKVIHLPFKMDFDSGFELGVSIVA